jgi:hypothetical protein
MWTALIPIDKEDFKSLDKVTSTKYVLHCYSGDYELEILPDVEFYNILREYFIKSMDHYDWFWEVGKDLQDFIKHFPKQFPNVNGKDGIFLASLLRKDNLYCYKDYQGNDQFVLLKKLL